MNQIEIAAFHKFIQLDDVEELCVSLKKTCAITINFKNWQLVIDG